MKNLFSPLLDRHAGHRQAFGWFARRANHRAPVIVEESTSSFLGAS